MYNQNGLLIVGILFVCMLLIMEIGYRVGRVRKAAADSAVIKSHIDAVLASMMGVLALLLGFTFSQALQRYDDRSKAVVAEANALGTAYLRIQLIPAEMRDGMQAQFRKYVAARIQDGSTDLERGAERQPQESDRLSGAIWLRAVAAVEKDSRPATVGLFIQALNDAIDSAGFTTAAMDRHVPDIAFFLLFGSIILTTATLGYASGVSGHRITLPAFALATLIVLVIYIVIDMDRPRRGFIQVSQDSMLSLRRSIAPAPR